MPKQRAPIVMKTKPAYDPTKKYTWPNDAKFELTGDQFGLWLNSVRSKITSPQAMEFRLAFDANVVIEKMMVIGVEAGIIVEAIDKPKK